ncbi:hypothetical protein [Phaeospirillum tilakii]|uniref:Uncharacterized protein n=1 Tax=Phaeospirillum tilakii TaxID=741673 RepID=A0ABW5CDV7_9PROT
MTLATTTSSVSYVGNGVTTTFDFGFEIPAGALVVTLTETDAVTILDASAYSATGLGSSAGGSVTLKAAPTSGQTVTLRRVLTPTQSVALVTGAAIYADVLEAALDRAAMVDQQLQEQIDRAVLVPVGSDVDPGAYLTTCTTAAANAAASAGTATAAATGAAASASAATTAATAAQQAVGGARVSPTDTTPAPLSTKLGVAGLVTKAITNPGAAEGLTLSVPIATQAEAEAGTAADKAMTPIRTAQAIAAQALSSFRNLLINTDFADPVNQRVYVSGAPTTAANQYTLDRWRVVTSGQALVWTGGALTAPAGGLEQVVEGKMIPRSGTYVLSWTGTATATVDGVAVANGGTVALTKGTNATVRFSGGTVQYPQLERGSRATAWEALPYDVTLARCWRYYEIVPFGGRYWGTGISTAIYEAAPFKVPKRVTPTITLPSATNAIWNATGGGATPTTWTAGATDSVATISASYSAAFAGIALNVLSANAEL